MKPARKGRTKVKYNIFNKGRDPEDEKNRRFVAPKGQWFIISAVIASGVFLSISVLFRSFFSIDASDVAMLDQDVLLSSMKDGWLKAIEESEPECRQLQRNLDEFKHFNMDKMSEKGYIADIKYGIRDCNEKAVDTHLLLVSSPSMEVWEGARPEVSSVEANRDGNGKVESLTITLKAAVPYGISGNASVYDNSFIDSVVFDIGRDETEVTKNLAEPIILSANAFARIRGYIFAGNRMFFV